MESKTKADINREMDSLMRSLEMEINDIHGQPMAFALICSPIAGGGTTFQSNAQLVSAIRWFEGSIPKLKEQLEIEQRIEARREGTANG